MNNELKDMLTFEQAKQRALTIGKEITKEIPLYEEHGLIILDDCATTFERGWVFELDINPEKPFDPPIHTQGTPAILVDKYNNECYSFPQRPWIDLIIKAYMDTLGQDLNKFIEKAGVRIKRRE